MNSPRPVAPARQRGARPVALALLAVLVLLLALALRPAAAAQLPLNPVTMTHVSAADRCTEFVETTHGTITAGQATTVKVIGLGDGCGGRDLALTLYGADGEALTSATTPLSADAQDSATVIVPTYAPDDVTGAAVTIGTWGVPATWIYTPPAASQLVTCTVLNDPTGTKTCEVKDLRIESWGYPQPDHYNFYATVTSPSASADTEWQLSINLADPAFDVQTSLADSSGDVGLAPGWSCSSMPMLELRGRAEVNSQYVGGDRSVTVWLQGMSASGPTSGGSLFNCS